MTADKKVWLSALIGLFVAMTANAFGVPWWRDWEVGDAFDFGVVAALIAWNCLTLRALAQQEREHAKG